MKCKNRINCCQAYFTNFQYVLIEHEEEEYEFIIKAIFIKSYNTYVAVYLPEFDYLISFGKYSMTTYQHIRKYHKNYCPSYTLEYNTGYTNWF